MGGTYWGGEGRERWVAPIGEGDFEVPDRERWVAPIGERAIGARAGKVGGTYWSGDGRKGGWHLLGAGYWGAGRKRWVAPIGEGGSEVPDRERWVAPTGAATAGKG
jgi:hypothetical protein